MRSDYVSASFILLLSLAYLVVRSLPFQAQVAQTTTFTSISPLGKRVETGAYAMCCPLKSPTQLSQASFMHQVQPT